MVKAAKELSILLKKKPDYNDFAIIVLYSNDEIICCAIFSLDLFSFFDIL